MNATAFAYHRPVDVQEAIALLTEHGENAKLIAGGHSLLPIMKLRLAEPEQLIDIARIPALQGVASSGNGVTIGAMTTHREVANDARIGRAAPVLAATASRIGDRQVRNRGTIGGALAHADAAADYPAAILALEATIVAQGPNGERTIAAGDFFVDFLTTALEPNEVLTRVEIAGDTAEHGWSYQKLANQASGYALVGIAALVAKDSAGKIADIRVGVTGAAAVPWRAAAVEAALRGQEATAEAITAAAAQVDGGVDILDDLHASEEYRRRVTRGLTQRAIQEALSRA